MDSSLSPVIIKEPSEQLKNDDAAFDDLQKTTTTTTPLEQPYSVQRTSSRQSSQTSTLIINHPSANLSEIQSRGTTRQLFSRAVVSRKTSSGQPATTMTTTEKNDHLTKSAEENHDDDDDDDDDSDDDDDDSFGSMTNDKSLANLIPQRTKLNEKVIINVGGQVHETFLATLNRLPETRLAKLAQDYENDQSYDQETGTFFFNRNPLIFVSILQYYRTGELHIDHNVCGNAIKNELDFWQIDANDIEPCCWAQYAKFLENKETLKMLDDSFAIYEDVFAEPENEEGWKRLRRRLWRHIEDPSYSVIGKVVASLSIFFVILSIVSYVLETHPFFRIPRYFPPDYAVNVTKVDSENFNGTLVNFTHYVMVAKNDTDRSNNNGDDNLDFFEMTENNSTVVWWLNCLAFSCFAWFVIEYLARVIVCPNKREFFRSVLNNLDLLVLLAMCFETLTVILVDEIPRNRYLRVLIPLRFARIMRIMKLMKHYRAFKVLVYTIKVSAKELALMIIFLMIGVVIFACLVYYVEPETFDNIPIGCWWALVTMTTVGYGDYHPYHVGGYIIGCVAAIFGVLMIAFTVPIVVNNFSLYYSHAQTRAKMRPKRRATKLLNKLAALTMFVPTLEEIQEANEADKKRLLMRKNRVKKMNSLPQLAKQNSSSSTVSGDSGVDDKKNKLRRQKSSRPLSKQQSVAHKKKQQQEIVRTKVIAESELDELTELPAVMLVSDDINKNSDVDIRRRTASLDRNPPHHFLPLKPPPMRRGLIVATPQLRLTARRDSLVVRPSPSHSKTSSITELPAAAAAVGAAFVKVEPPMMRQQSYNDEKQHYNEPGIIEDA